MVDKLRRRVIALLGTGNVSKAVSLITSHGVANINAPEVRRQLEEKHPARERQLPRSVIKQSPVQNLKGLRYAMLDLRKKKGTSPGAGGCRGEFLVTLAETFDADKMQQLEDFCLRYLQSELPPWFTQVLLTTRTVALFKDEEEDAIRPLGIRHPLIRCVHRLVVSANREEVKAFLEPQQLAMSEGGCTKLYHSINTLLDLRRDFICVKLDCKNAFNSCSRARLVKVLSEEPSLRHLASHAATSLAAPTALEDRGELFGWSEDGFPQGCPEAAPEYCVSWQEQVVEMDQAVSQDGGCSLMLMDDGYVVGLPQAVFLAIRVFERDIKEECGLTLQRKKCEVFSWTGEVPEGCVPGFTLAGRWVDGRFEPGFICVGAPIGTDMYVKSTIS